MPAKNDYQQQKQHWQANPLPPDDPRHGTVNGYRNCFCRCQLCRAAWAEYHRKYDRAQRNRKAPPGSVCDQPGCTRKRDRAYLTGYCHRHNIELGLKPERRKAAPKKNGAS